MSIVKLLLFSNERPFICIIMNWRTITGLILLILGVRAFYIAIVATTPSATYTKIGSFVWIGVGVFLILKGITKKEQ